MSTPIPILHVPTAADRAQAHKVLAASGIYWGGLNNKLRPNDVWENAYGHISTWIEPRHPLTRGYRFASQRDVDDRRHTFRVNSPAAFVSYCRRHRPSIFS
jgi:hypothetical protein